MLARLPYHVAGEDLRPALSGDLPAATAKLVSDKSTYEAGEFARLDIVSPFEGLALVTLEADRVLVSKWVKVSAGTNAAQMEVPEGYSGRAFLSASLVRSSKDAARFLKAYARATAPVTLNMKPRTLGVKLEAPAVVPDTRELKVTVKSDAPGRVFLWAVDTGILSLTGYRTPSPVHALLEDRGLQVDTRQTLEGLMPEGMKLPGEAPFGGGFGSAQRRNPNAPQRGESIRMSIAISFEEAAFGCEKAVTVERYETCDTCHGNGCAPGTSPEVCPDCHGTGTVQVRRQTPMGVFATSSPCPKCGGKGRIIHQPCKDCRGSGMVRKKKTIQASIPAGIDNGQTISIRGQGNAGKNGGPAGDLLITITVRPHELFRREGTSVLCEAPITFTQAVLGAELEIPTIDGRVKYTIPEGTQTGTVFRLRGKGIPVLNGRGRGDQYVTVTIETPRDLNREQKEALKKFSETLGEGNYEKHRSFFGKKK